MAATPVVNMDGASKTPPAPSPFQSSKLTTMRILVTGGAGFIGSYLVDRLMQEGTNEVDIMKWLESFKEKVSQPTSSPTSPGASPSHQFFEDGILNRPRDKDELDQYFRYAWEDFRSSVTEKEKKKALDVAVSLFCQVGRQNSDLARLALSLVDVRSFAFVVVQALVTEIKRLQQGSLNKQLQLDDILSFFSGSQVEMLVQEQRTTLGRRTLDQPPLSSKFPSIK